MSIEIHVAAQALHLYQDDGSVTTYTVSSASNGVGFDEGSYCTPTGQFEISEKIGDGEVLGTVFKARQAVGVWQGKPSEQDMVLTRILRLHGLDVENANTMDRYIYIHGTNHEELLGHPASCGCIRMSNADIVDLFDRVQVGEKVAIIA